MEKTACPRTRAPSDRASATRRVPLVAVRTVVGAAAVVPQTPAVQIVLSVQAFPSSQGVPSGSVVVRQPTAGSQDTVVQGVGAGHWTGSRTHCPLTQRSFVVQALASAQSASCRQQPASAVCTHARTVSSQRSALQTLPSSQETGTAVQMPLRQVSAPLQ